MNRLMLDDLLSHILDMDGLDQADMRARIDMLERIIERWRFENDYFENSLPVEDFYKLEVFADLNRVIVRNPRRELKLIPATTPVQMQPSLLVFLLIHHGRNYQVYRIIEAYIKTIRPQLSPLDFKKTQTGVTRCFTNARFAANALRDYGFLKYTEVEAFKTWTLSLTGFIVASRLLEKNRLDYGGILAQSSLFGSPHWDIHPSIQNVWEEFGGFDDFVGQLAKICLPNADLFHTFNAVLKTAYGELSKYWMAMRDPEVKRQDRKRQSIAALKRIENRDGMDDFYRQLSTAVNVERFVKDVKLIIAPPRP